MKQDKRMEWVKTRRKFELKEREVGSERASDGLVLPADGKVIG